MIKFGGLNEMSFFTGIVEDRFDPSFLGRVRVRIYGVHSDDKQNIATPDLPWSDVLMPNTGSSLSGLGVSPHGLVEGTTVMGFWRDGDDMQAPVIIGTLFGTPGKHYKLDERNEGILRSPDKGFNDPRQESYEGKPDGKDPQHITRGFGLSVKLSDTPVRPSNIKQELDGTGTTVEKGTPKNYPKEEYYDQSDINPAGRGDYDQYPNSMIISHDGAIVKESELYQKKNRDNIYKPVYPYNKVTETESGHVFEVDDSVGAERIHTYHRSGTREEIIADGTKITKIVNDHVEIILKDHKVLIAGSADIELKNGNYNLVTTGSTNITATENCNITAQGDCKVTASGDIDMKGANILLNSVKQEGS